MVGADNKQPLTTRLGAYEIIRPLARGGMAELFLVRVTGPEGFEKVLVLKKILPHFAENPRFVRSFLDEAKLVAGFDHPHIAHVHDMGTADGSYFFTMEFVHGVDVRTICKRYRRARTPLPLELVVLIIRNVASALHYAHERCSPDGRSLDVVHRDVSPSNIIVSYEGVPKLVDFGIAKATSSSMKTQTGALKGKIAYMSPEQAKGAPIDRRTDVFALGIILWELITNRRLYKSDNDMATIQRIIYKPVDSPRKLRPDCPPALERIVLRALALDIDKRYQTAEQLQTDLEDFALETKLKQSAVALSAELKRTFAVELKLWAAVQAGPATVTDHLALASDDPTTRRLTLPNFGEDEEEDDDESDLEAAPRFDDASIAPTAISAMRTQPAVDELPRSSLTFSGEAVPLRRNRSRKWFWVAGIGAVAAIGIVLGVVTSTSEPDSVPTPASNVEQVEASDQVEPLVSPPREPDPKPVPDEIEMAPDEVAKQAQEANDAAAAMAKTDAKTDTKTDAKRVKKQVSTKKAVKKDTKPAVEDSRLKKATKPVVEDSKPKQDTKPGVDESKLKKDTKPVVEEPKPKRDPKPVVEESKPKRDPKPAVEDSKLKKDTKPTVEESKPKKDTKPAVEDSKPKQDPKPVEEPKPKPKFDPNAVFPPSS